jgi:hypothetical protein
MMDDPSWVWVDGDPVLSNLFLLALCMVLAFAVVLLIEFAVVLSRVSITPSGLPSAGTSSSAWELFWVSWLVELVAVLIVLIVPRRISVIRRIGISAGGLCLVLAFSHRMVPWTSVTRWGPDWVEVSPRHSLPVRFRLTRGQAERLARFLTPLGPASRFGTLGPSRPT